MVRGRKKEGREPWTTKVYPVTRDTLRGMAADAGGKAEANHAIDALASLAAEDPALRARVIQRMQDQARPE